MTYELAIGDRAYSSWSLRGWLLLEAFGLPVRTRRAQMRTPAFAALLEGFAPARTVPALRSPEGVATDSLAILEELAQRHPEAGHWPEDPEARMLARSIVAEMHSGYGALRAACPMNLRTAWGGFEPSDAVLADLDRIAALWRRARARAGEGPWLFGRFTAADAFHAPVAARIAGYGLPVADDAAAYVETQLTTEPFRRWRAMGLVDGPDQAVYEMGLPRAPWPFEPRERGTASEGPSENDRCPYSGGPVTHFLALGGRVWGFCDAFCRDKTAADPLAWPEFRALL
jgi:glutathione S-transferase